MSLVRNERSKLLANALDRASTACFTVGIATPLAGYLYGVLNFADTLDYLWIGFAAFSWLLATVALHFGGRRVLGALKE